MLIDAAQRHPDVLEVDSCRVVALEPSSVSLALRAWCPDAATAKTTEYDFFETTIGLFREHGIEIPFPTRNVNLFDNDRSVPAVPTTG